MIFAGRGFKAACLAGGRVSSGTPAEGEPHTLRDLSDALARIGLGALT